MIEEFKTDSSKEQIKEGKVIQSPWGWLEFQEGKVTTNPWNWEKDIQDFENRQNKMNQIKKDSLLSKQQDEEDADEILKKFNEGIVTTNPWDWEIDDTNPTTTEAE